MSIMICVTERLEWLFWRSRSNEYFIPFNGLLFFREKRQCSRTVSVRRTRPSVRPSVLAKIDARRLPPLSLCSPKRRRYSNSIFFPSPSRLPSPPLSGTKAVPSAQLVLLFEGCTDKGRRLHFELQRIRGKISSLRASTSKFPPFEKRDKECLFLSRDPSSFEVYCHFYRVVCFDVSQAEDTFRGFGKVTGITVPQSTA